MILKTLEVGPFASNCYIVASEKTKEAMVIDPGDEAGAILNTVKKLGLTVKLIVITHGHGDHVSALGQVKEATGAPVAIHGDDAAIMRGSGQMLTMMLGVKSEAPPAPDMLLKDGEVIKVGELSFKVAHTPGHSPGGICLIGEGVAFTGDSLFNYGIGRTDFPGSSYEELMDSIRTRLLTLPDDTVVLPGHGPETTIGDERRGNPFLRVRGM